MKIDRAGKKYTVREDGHKWTKKTSRPLGVHPDVWSSVSQKAKKEWLEEMAAKYPPL